MRADGFVAHDVRPLVRLNVSIVAEQNGRRETGSFGIGGRRLYDDLFIAERAKAIALETAMEREMNSSGAKEAIDQFNNGMVTLKELVNKLVSIEVELNK